MGKINDKPRFGPAGNGQKFYDSGYKSTLEICKWLAKNGLSAYEYQATRGIKASSDFIDLFSLKAKQFDIALSIHAPYYISMGSPEQKMQDKSIGYIIDSLRAAKRMSAQKVVIHLGGACKQDRKVALENAKRLMEKVLEKAESEDLLERTFLCPETMGKPGQLGTLDEVLDICTMHEKLSPTLDFGHLHAIGQGAMKDKRAFELVFEKVEKILGKEAAYYPHIHFSPIEYGKSGEIRHRRYEEKSFGPVFDNLAEVSLDLGLIPNIICESAGTQVEDAIEFQKIYNQIKTDRE